MTRIRRLCWALVLLGLGAGTALDGSPPRPPVRRAGRRVLEVDLHAHTRFGDGLLSPVDLVWLARRRGLDALAVTEHNILYPALLARSFSRLAGGPTVIVGEEITTRDHHLVGLGLRERVPAGGPITLAIDAIHRQGGLAVAAHPTPSFWPAYEPVLDQLDGAEIAHPLGYDNDVTAAALVRFSERATARGRRPAAVGSSDYHFFSVLGLCRTLVFTEGDDHESASEAAILAAVRAGRTVVVDRHGRSFGDPALIEALKAEPYTINTQDYGYRGSGLFDRVTRALGFVGLLGLVALKRRRS